MGQIFYACAYDIETRTCCTYNADKFHANCYSFSGAIMSMHYLLRQKPYRIMWGGDYIVTDNNLEYVSTNEELLGISTYCDYEDFKMNNENLESKTYYAKVKFMDENRKLWKWIKVSNEAKECFARTNPPSVKYSGYLVNHTQEQAIDLAHYYEKSKSYLNALGEMCIDALPVLTETGGGMGMALFEGLSYETTEELNASWCGNLLQIVDELPEGYEIIDCCFANIWYRADYCYRTFGVNKDGYLLNDTDGKLFVGTALDVLFGKRGASSYIKAETDGNNIKYIPVPINKSKEAN